ncbi:hypothetical protein [Shinella oryzae]|uniref:Uncharacterized protein n=1 Tax=Shinella oryzae TaxID=2871820 RepID=A0ABY9K8V8_9HYPH|nr:hypothetical protein [Shinella oryzae]WLS05008.1 hypothetical protein Q9315_22810 [Shinella oryzae]
MTARKFLGASSVVAIGLISAATLWLFLQHDFCENIVLDVLASPDGRWQAVAFERNCGATASTSMNISLMTNSDNPHGSGNIFVSEGRSAQLAWKNSLGRVDKVDSQIG